MSMSRYGSVLQKKSGIDMEKGNILHIMAPSDPTHVIKRDGTLASFDRSKIRRAMELANRSIPSEFVSDDVLDRMTDTVIASFSSETPSVEEIQDIVEYTLFSERLFRTTKAFIIYREAHTRRRDSADDLMKLYRDMTFASSHDVDMKRENANIDADTAMGTMLKYGSEGSKYFIDRYILPEEIEEAHTSGDIHIHDKDFYMLTETCCQIDLQKLFHDGFSTGHGYLREPQSINSYAALACIALQANQNEMHGGQSIPDFDYAMAPGVIKTYRKKVAGILTGWASITGEEIDLDAVTRCVNKVERLEDIASLRQDLVELLNGRTSKSIDRILELALERTRTDTNQAMQALVHNLNTMNSRAGAQVPFSSLNYGTDTSEAGRMVISELLEVTLEGLGNGETPIFPVQIFKVKEGVNTPGDPNYDLFQKAIRTSSKRLFPNFSFLDAPFNLAYYRDGDPDTEVAYMGCRTRVIGNVYDPDREVTKGRGNLSFTSINLPRLGIEARGSVDTFFKELDKKLDLVFRQLKHRFDIQRKKRVYNYPFLMGQGVWIGSDDLRVDDEVGEVLSHGTLSVGFIGLAETLVALTGMHHGESAASQKLGLAIVRHMRERCDEQSRLEGLNYTLLATPAEGLSGRFLRIDRQKYGELHGITDHDFYTNSFHVPVYFPITVAEKICREAPYHELTNAGHISYVELDGDMANNLDAFERIVLFMKDKGIGYGSINHPVDRDPVCGYTGIINDVCPRCGRRAGESISVEKLEELRRRYPDVPPSC